MQRNGSGYHSMSDGASVADDITRSTTRRAEALADALLAIIITVFVLDLKTPDRPPGQLWQGLVAQWPKYTAFVTSFLYVAVVWLNHKATFSRIEEMDIGLHWAHFAVLGSTSLLPFPTVLIASAMQDENQHDQRVAVAVYAGIGSLLCITWTYLFHYLGNHPHLVADSTEEWFFHAERVRTGVALFLYVAAGLLGFFVHPYIALAVFFLLPIFYGITSHGLTESPRIIKSALNHESA